MPRFQLYDRVRVIAAAQSFDGRLSRRAPQVGDVGTIVMAYDSPSKGYTVEAVQEDGQTAWLADFRPDQLESV
jgi:hypothetical protein